MAIKLAQTGHLILTTIHSKDSLGVLLRLENLGIDKHLIVDTLKLIVSQRLLRVRCCDCLGKIESCKKCYGTGYSGRILLGEVLKFNNYHKELMSKNNYKELIIKEIKNDLFINHCANAYVEYDKGGRRKVAKKNKDSVYRIDLLACVLNAIRKKDLLESENLINAIASGNFSF